MDFSSIGQNWMQSATGNISKAVLCIRDVANAVLNADDGIDNGLSLAENSAIKAVTDLNKSLMAKAEDTLKGKKTTSFDDIKGLAGGKQYIALELQYNPTSLRLDTTAGRQMAYSGGAGAVQLQQYTAPASTTLSCELLFDDCNTMDAFMLSDNPVTGLTIGNIGNAAASAVKGDFSVRKQIEGLLSLLTVKEARHVLFFWGAMCFRGEMTEASAKYTMFNKKGFPVRGTVSIQIRQGDSEEGGHLERQYRYDDQYWMNSFDKTFTAQGNSTEGWRQATTNNLLNLNL